MQEINFILNGVKRKIVVDPQKSLLKVIREDLRLTGTKEGCSAGHCGTCAVLVENEVVLSCRYPVIKALGKMITTIEGIGTLKNPHPLQLAFAKMGAIQCGFCTPGMIVRSKSLLDRNPAPKREEIKKALQPHLCRCTGYQKIFEAVEFAASYLRGEKKSIDLKLEGKDTIGQPVTRIDALEKATGTTLYAGDITIDGITCIKVLRSPHHHAKIIHIDGAEAEAVPGVLSVLTAEDVKGTNILKMAGDDQPILCRDKVRFIGDPVAAVVATSEDVASYALEKIEVTYEPLEPVLTPEEALKETIKVHDDRPNLFFQQPVLHGDIKKGFSEAEVVVEQNYSTPAIEHAYLENDSGVAFIHENGQLVIMSGSQNIHAHRKTIAEAIGLNVEKVRVIQTPTGGAFGGKLDVSVGGILGLAAFKLKKPVKLIYTRGETFAATSKRHPFFMKVKIGAKRDGTLTAMDFDLLADGGAYKSFSNSVTTRGLIHSQGPYRFPNAHVFGRAVYTNTAFKGAMRGFGAPQVAFAIESILDEVATELKMDPLALRIKNGFVTGDTTICGQILDHAIGFQKCLESIWPQYEKALKEAKAKETDEIRRGVGFGGVWFGPGRSSPDQSEAWAELLSDDTLQVWIGAADMGQGSDTMFWQIAAETMGFPLERVRLCTTDTEITPDGNFSAGSRQTYVSGKAVQMAVIELKKAMEENTVRNYNEMKSKGIPTLYKAVNKPITTRLDPKDGHGIPWETYSFGIQMAEVAVEIKTGKVNVLKVTSVHDLGTVINHQNVEGQLHGGIAMGLGYALMEEFIYNQTDSLAKFKIPRARDIPELKVMTLDIPREKGPFGASGTAEYADVPTAPAIANAIFNACGVRIRDLPITSEKIKRSLPLLK